MDVGARPVLTLENPLPTEAEFSTGREIALNEHLFGRSRMEFEYLDGAEGQNLVKILKVIFKKIEQKLFLV